jgi:hypothetical protein
MTIFGNEPPTYQKHGPDRYPDRQINDKIIGHVKKNTTYDFSEAYQNSDDQQESTKFLHAFI